jgi:hypothetical protein
VSWLRENSFLAGLATVTVLGCGALIFLMMQAMSHYQETSDAYTQAVQKLHMLQNRSPFPNAENLEKSQLLKEQYSSELDALRAELSKMQTPLDPETKPQKFQDDLRTAVNLVTEKATAAGVELPKGFYLGFSQYANSLPNEHAAPALARELDVIEGIVMNLINLKVRSVDGLERLPLPEESGTNLPPQQPEGPRKRGKESETNSIVINRLPFRLDFTAEQGKLRVEFNSLLDPSQFLVIRDLTIQNTSLVGPPISRSPTPPTIQSPPESPRDQSSGSPSNHPGSTPAPGDLNVILGRELVKASMRVEIIDFPAPEQPKK